ncbi:MAG: polysaccharide deacetylase family protein [Pirellulales bacterium]
MSTIHGSKPGSFWLGKMKLLLVLLLIANLANSSLGQSSKLSRKLIVHIDDAGLCHAANVATMRSLESGASTSASIMMPCEWAREFATYAKLHPEYCYGIHFTLNCEWDTMRWGPLAGRDRVPSLVDEEGYMWSGVDKIAKHAKADEVEIELRAQVELAKKLGIPISHFDTHMGSVMARPDIVEVYVKLALEYDKPILWLRRLDGDQQQGYPHLNAALEKVVAEMDKRKLPVLDTLLQFYGNDDLAAREKTYRDAIEKSTPGITQLIIHSAVEGDELAAITTSHLRRNQDFELFSNRSLKEWIEGQKIELTSWKKLTEEMRKK